MLHKKYLFILFFCFDICAMILEESSDLIPQETIEQQLKRRNTKIINAINTKQLNKVIESFKDYENSRLIFRNKRKNTDFLQEALDAANENIISAKSNLSWQGNRGRRGKLFAGVTGVLFGFGKIVYESTIFGNKDTQEVNEKVGYALNIAGNFSLIGSGLYTAILAFENGSAKNEYNQALAIKFLIENQAVKE
ncbi:MAG: hypothetical protein WDZ41_00330 [Candidatus Babeliales bacterium]